MKDAPPPLTPREALQEVDAAIGRARRRVQNYRQKAEKLLRDIERVLAEREALEKAAK